DSEIILHLMAQPTVAEKENNLVQTVRRIEGAFSLVIITDKELIGVLDPHGLRPLSLASLGEGCVLASETGAFDLIHAKFLLDIVVPVPDSGNWAALGYSEESKIPFEMAFVRNHYVGRSFLQPTPLIRDFNVRVKLNLIGELVKGKRVIAVDDSIVRGTTCKARVNNLKEAGAKEVHVLVSCPPHMNPCVYGIDFPDRS